MSLQTDKRELDTKISRYMTLLSNLSKPPADYINDLDYFRGLVQIANQKEIAGLTQTWDAIRPKDARSAHFIETGQISDGRATQLKSLIDLTWQIMILRGGPTSGNWAHDGRPGKKGGSGRGGGFSRIGVKSGKAGRGKIKQSSRQTRVKRERGKGAGAKARSGEIPAGVVSRAKASVSVAKAKRDKELSVARKGEIEVEKARAKGLKAQEKYFNSAGKTAIAYKAWGKERDKATEKENKIFDFVGDTSNNFLDPKTKAKAEKLRSDFKEAEARATKARDKWHKLDRKSQKDREAYNKADAEFQAVSDKYKGNRKPKDIMADYQKETDQASKVLFQHNLNEAKAVRAKMKEIDSRWEEDIKQAVKDKATQEKRVDEMFDRMKKSNLPDSDPRAFDMIDKSLAESRKLGEINTRLKELRDGPGEQYKNLVKVDSPTKIIVAPGSERNRGKVKDGWKTGREAFQEIVSDEVLPKGTPVQFVNTDEDRSFHLSIKPHSRVAMAEYAGPITMTHELGHAAEEENPRLLKRSIDWRNGRTKGEKLQKLSDVTGDDSFDSSEVTKPNKFIDSYIGKDYGSRASEVFSMGIQEMYRAPKRLADRDPDMFDFIYAQARTP